MRALRSHTGRPGLIDGRRQDFLHAIDGKAATVLSASSRVPELTLALSREESRSLVNAAWQS